MITVKALIAVSLTALGGAATGAAIYMQTHPPIPAAAPTVLPPAGNWAGARLPVRLAPPEPEARALVQMEPVYVTAPLPPKKATVSTRRKRASAAAPAPPNATVVCSDWMTLESGPENARVRMLCTPAPAKR